MLPSLLKNPCTGGYIYSADTKQRVVFCGPQPVLYAPGKALLTLISNIMHVTVQ
jgi:hypothetical protein